MESVKQQKTSRLIQKEMSNVFLEVSEQMFNNAIINVTFVRVNSDLSHAKIYVSIYGTNIDKKDIFSKIKFNEKLLNHLLTQKIKNKMRFMPEIEFFYDDSYDYIKHIEELLKK
ncbi:MAG: 30S ribosome-binding factor RbfA [Bacteroidales bacterium]|nr:30S ribosome-binding factor RbfA [Bacteroidales bacterium]